MGMLAGALLYLSGPMEFAPDSGVEWRKKFRRLAQEAKLNIKIIDPTNKPGASEKESAEEKSHQENLQKSGRFEELRQFVHDYRRKDLRFVDLSDALVVVIDRNIYQCGTLNELFEAERQHKPILTICQGGLYRLPRWLFDVVDFNLIFENVESVIDHLITLDRSDKLDDRWVLIRRFLD